MVMNLSAVQISWRRERQPTPVFLFGEFHGWRSLTGYSPWGHKELDMTEQQTLFQLHEIDFWGLFGNQSTTYNVVLQNKSFLLLKNFVTQPFGKLGFTLV